MFVGTHTPKLDDKGRLFLPARFREELAGGLVMTKGQDHCLFVYTRSEFLEQATTLKAASVTSKAQRDYARIFFASAYDDVPDKQGRVTVPAKLREYAGLSRDVVVVGAFTRLELWDAAAWDAYEAAQEPGFADLDEEVLPR